MSPGYPAVGNLGEVYLEDSYVLAIGESEHGLVFELEAVLTPQSSRYRPPASDEQYCYADGRLVFSDVTAVAWLSRTEQPSVDAAGESDLGNIDTLVADGGSYEVTGDWGRVRITGGTPPRFEYDD